MRPDETEEPGVKKRDRCIARLIAGGSAYHQVAAKLGISRATVARRAGLPEVKRLVDQVRDQLTSAMLGVLVKNGKRAARVLVELAESGTPRDHVRLTAAGKVIDSVLKVREQTDLIRRVEELQTTLALVQDNAKQIDSNTARPDGVQGRGH